MTQVISGFIIGLGMSLAGIYFTDKRFWIIITAIIISGLFEGSMK